MNDLINDENNSTSLSEQEMSGLIPPWISTREDLNLVESENIQKAQLKVFSRKNSNILSETYIKKLHKLMFGDVWKWAGTYRHTEKNLGIPFYQIPMEIFKLLDNVTFWVNHQTYPWDEIGVRFHHRLVSIHPFSNGNGRHARLITDVLLQSRNLSLFTWGGIPLGPATDHRKKYISALQKADKGDYSDLLNFVRS